MTDFRALCAELLDEIPHESPTTCLARAALAEPQGEEPTDEEIMALMPQKMHDDLAAAARSMVDQAGTDSRRAMGMIRIILNRHAVDLARAVLARWGRLAPSQPVPVSERLPGAEDCDAEGFCWWMRPGTARRFVIWCFGPKDPPSTFGATHWLPADALPLPGAE